jgi:hypothetical protein
MLKGNVDYERYCLKRSFLSGNQQANFNKTIYLIKMMELYLRKVGVHLRKCQFHLRKPVIHLRKPVIHLRKPIIHLQNKFVPHPGDK